MLDKIATYFLLERLVAGKESGTDRQLILYTGVLAGCGAQWLLQLLTTGNANWPALLLSIVASIVIFPAVWDKAGLKRIEVNFAKWCVAFQNGFFWPTLMDQVGKSIR